MTLEAQFNALDGKRVSRRSLETLLTKAKKQKKPAIARRVSALLDAHQDAFFDIQINKPISARVQPKKSSRKAPVKKTTEVKPKATVVDLKRNTLGARIAAEKNIKVNRRYFQFSNAELAKFMGKIEVKPVESVVVTLAAPKGAGKTTFLLKMLDDLAQNHTVGIASLEIHPKSGLFEDIASKCWSKKAINEIEAPEIEAQSDFEKLVANNEVIAVDSFGKLKKLFMQMQLDDGLRKKFNGKLFILIFQLTTNKTMRGGSDSEFDGDINLFIEKGERFAENYVWSDKNRYNDQDLSTLKYNFTTGKLIKPALKDGPDKNAAPKKSKLSFKVTAL